MRHICISGYRLVSHCFTHFHRAGLGQKKLKNNPDLSLHFRCYLSYFQRYKYFRIGWYITISGIDRTISRVRTAPSSSLWSKTWIRRRSLLSKIFNGLLFGWTLSMYRPNLKSVALGVPEIIGRTLKLWTVPGYGQAPFSPNFNSFLFGWTLWMYRPNLKSVALPVPEIMGYLKTLGSPWIRPRSLLSKIFNGLLFGWNLSMYRPNLKSVALGVREIIGVL